MKLKSKTNKQKRSKSTSLATKESSGVLDIQGDALSQLISLSKNASVKQEENLDFLEDKKFEGFDPTAGLSVDVVGMVLDAIENTNLVAPDMKIDDSSCPEAPNVLEWLLGDEFLGCEPPYLEQALICVQLFAEYCPDCSDTEWMKIENHEPQEGLGALLENVTMMNYGICPECGAHRSDLIKEQKLNFYNELAVLAGQRCVTGETLVLSSKGIRRIDSWDTNRPYGFSPLQEILHNGTELEQTSDYYKGKPEKCYLVKLSNGTCIKGTSDHPIYVYDRFKTLPNIEVGEYVPVKIGQNVWGTELLSYQEILDKTDKMFQSKVDATISSKKHQLKNTNLLSINKVKYLKTDIFKLMGLWVSEGRGLGISNTDSDILDFVETTFGNYVNKRYISRDSKGVRLSGYRAQCWLSSLMGMSSTEELWTGSSKKHIPLSVMSAPCEYVCAFLSGLFDGDGSCRDGRHQLKYYTSSKRLGRELQVVLHNLGIPVSLSFSIKTATNGKEGNKTKCWTLTIKGKYLEVFKNKIGFISSRKQQDLDSQIESYKARTSLQTFSYEYLPSQLRDRIASYLPTIQEELNQHVIKSELPGVSGSRLGLQTVFGRDGCKLKFSYKDHVKRDLPLTKDKVQRTCELLREYRSYLGNETLQEISYWESFVDDTVYWERVEKVGVSKKEYVTYDFTLPKTHRFVANSLLNHNSGKSIVTAMASTYITHRILKMQKPGEIYNVGKGQILHGTFVALTAGQAKDTLWDPYYGYLMESPWFKKYHALLDHYQRKYHQEFYKLKDTFVLYKHRKLTVYPAGPDKRVLRGRTRIFGAIDEIGWFDNSKDNKKIKIDANGVYEAVVRSLATVRSSEERLIEMGFDQAMTAHMLNISSPSSIRDKICELVRTAQHSVKTLGIHAPTWKMNPNITRNSGFLLEEYRKDPVTAQRDYGAEPPLSSNPFIGNVELVREAFNPKLRNPIKYTPKVITVGKEKYRYAEIDKIQETNRPSIMCLDAGYSNNSFALVVGSYGSDMVPTIDIIVEIMSMPGIPLSYTMIYDEVMRPLIESRNVRIVLADRWNSIKILQDAQLEYADRDLQQRQYSLKYSDFWNIKNALQQFAFRIPMIEKGQELDEVLRESLEDYPRCFEGRPVSHLALQVLTVQDSGRTVTKGEGELTDDIWRATCLAYWGMQEDEYMEILTAEENKTEAVRKPLGYSIMGSSQGANTKPAGSSGTKTASGGGVLGLLQGRK